MRHNLVKTFTRVLRNVVLISAKTKKGKEPPKAVGSCPRMTTSTYTETQKGIQMVGQRM